MVVVWFFGFLLEPSKKWLMDLELWIFTKLILPKLRVLFSATVRCGAYLKSTCNSAANSLGFWPKNQIEQQESASTTSASWLLMKLAYFLTIQLLHIQCSTPWSGFPPMIGLHISFVKSLDARILVCRFFFFEPNIDMPVALPRGFGGQCFRQKKKGTLVLLFIGC